MKSHLEWGWGGGWRGIKRKQKAEDGGLNLGRNFGDREK